MGKTLGSILRVAGTIVGTYIGGPIGLAVAVGANVAASVFFKGALPKAPTVETAIKNPRPERVSAYGRPRARISVTAS